MGVTKYSSLNCGDNVVPGTAIPSCVRGSNGQASKPFFFEKGVSIPLASLNKQYMINLIKSRQLHVLPKFDGFKSANSQNATVTSEYNVESETVKGLPKWEMEFWKGDAFDNLLQRFGGQDQFDFGLGFQDGIRFFANSDDTALTGGDAGMVMVGIQTDQDKSNAQKQMLTVQLKDAAQFNLRKVFKSYAELGFNEGDLKPVYDVDIAFTTAPTTGTSVTVDVAYGLTGLPVLGLSGTGIWKVGGVQTTPKTVTTAAVVVGVPGRYTLTLSSALIATDTISAILGDVTYNVAEDITGNLYAGETELATV